MSFLMSDRKPEEWRRLWEDAYPSESNLKEIKMLAARLGPEWDWARDTARRMEAAGVVWPPPRIEKPEFGPGMLPLVGGKTGTEEVLVRLKRKRMRKASR
jgi:hypothetical protein